MNNVMINPDGTFRVTFNEKLFRRNNGKGKSCFIPTTEELKIGVAVYLQENHPDLLECKVTKLMNSLGHHILWTPPYCPHLQPIELFWAAGKNHAASMNFADTTMYDTVKYLRDGWYGNVREFSDVNNQPEPHVLRREKVDCKRLFDHVVENINTIAIPVTPST